MHEQQRITQHCNQTRDYCYKIDQNIMTCTVTHNQHLQKIEILALISCLYSLVSLYKMLYIHNKTLYTSEANANPAWASDIDFVCAIGDSNDKQLTIDVAPFANATKMSFVCACPLLEFPPSVTTVCYRGSLSTTIDEWKIFMIMVNISRSVNTVVLQADFVLRCALHFRPGLNFIVHAPGDKGVKKRVFDTLLIIAKAQRVNFVGEEMFMELLMKR